MNISIISISISIVVVVTVVITNANFIITIIYLTRISFCFLSSILLMYKE